MFKSNWGGWLVLASVVVFPSMLYLARPVSTDTVQKSENSSPNYAEVRVAHAENKNPQRSSASVGRSVNDVDRAEELELEPDLNTIADRAEEESAASVWEEHYPTANQPSSRVQTYNPPENYNKVSGEGLSGNRIVGSDYAVSTNFQAAPATGSTKSSSRTAQQQENLNNIKASENSSLYLAEIQAPIQNNKSKCPPVYMELNGYAKNMRIAMGCDSE